NTWGKNPKRSRARPSAKYSRWCTGKSGTRTTPTIELPAEPGARGLDSAPQPHLRGPRTRVRCPCRYVRADAGQTSRCFEECPRGGCPGPGTVEAVRGGDL